MPDKTAYEVIVEFLESEEAGEVHSCLFTRDDGAGIWCIDGYVHINLLAKKIESWAIRLGEHERSKIELREDAERTNQPKP